MSLSEQQTTSEPEQRKAEKKIPLVEIFGPTIQGEGSVIGQQTYFLRFGLCDYTCKMCDSMHAVDPHQVRANARWLTQMQIADEFFAMTRTHTHSTPWITFTGGNPCIHDLMFLVNYLNSQGYMLHVETQGTFLPEWLRFVDSVCASPKGPGMGEDTDLEVLDKFVEGLLLGGIDIRLTMKIVVFDERDLEFAALLWERYQRYWNIDWYLSLGNPEPPGLNPEPQHGQHTYELIQSAAPIVEALERYRQIFDSIKHHPVLHKFRFLPQWHWFVWGNAKGK
jgi:7-carboxy-7-deazaguanine synthase